ncbi:MAG TPA: hypothetical protein VLI92_04045 [Candidatus Saccharimonadales bacterium]|nr:hypothetical protein [Candidatus Saccharimonadales bacterium]
MKQLFAFLVAIVLGLGMFFGLHQGLQTPEQTATAVVATTSTPLPTATPKPVATATASAFGNIVAIDGAVSVEAQLIAVPTVVKSVETVKDCQLSVVGAVAMARQVAAEYKIPWGIWGPLILSESSFHQEVPDSNGNCVVNTSYDNGKAVAYGLGQINLSAHPQLDTQRIKSDPRYNLEIGAQILLSSGSNWKERVANYKYVTTDSWQFRLYVGYQGAKGFTDTASGTWISWDVNGD